jgi:SHS family lactate transporter-like MFS transporter
MRQPCRNHASHFEKAKPAFEEGAGDDELEADEIPSRDKLPDDDEKASVRHINHA